MAEQATHRTPDGILLRRWYVYCTGNHRLVTWASRRMEARSRAKRRGYIVLTVRPAPSVLLEDKEDGHQ